MIEFVGYKSLDFESRLEEVSKGIFVLNGHIYSFRLFKEGFHVYVKNSENISIFKIIEPWDEQEEMSDYILRLQKFISKVST